MQAISPQDWETVLTLVASHPFLTLAAAWIALNIGVAIFFAVVYYRKRLEPDVVDPATSDVDPNDDRMPPKAMTNAGWWRRLPPPWRILGAVWTNRTP
jgi:hypothetical protein